MDDILAHQGHTPAARRNLLGLFHTEPRKISRDEFIHKIESRSPGHYFLSSTERGRFVIPCPDGAACHDAECSGWIRGDARDVERFIDMASTLITPGWDSTPGLVVGIGGKKRHGKDTLAHLLIEAAAEDTDWETFGMSDALNAFLLAQNPWVHVSKPVFYTPPVSYRRVLATGHYRYAYIVEAIGYERAKDEIPDFRDLLKATGGEAGRGTISDTVWVDKAEQRIRRLWSENKSVILTSTRYANERELIRNLGGITILVERLGYVDDGDTHSSETDMDPADFDLHIQAASLDELKAAVPDILATIRGEEL